MQITGQVDSDGNRLSTNSETSGRYHSDWLNMMYPRLKLARNLLKDDGVIFISIDDNEVANLRKLCDDIFGEDNFAGEFIWKKKQGGGNDSNVLVVEHEYIIAYAKTINNFIFQLDTNYKLDDNLYPFNDEFGEYGLITLDKSSIRFSESLVFEIKDNDGNSYFPRIVNGKQSCWRWGKDKVEKDFDKLVFKNEKVYTKYYRPNGITPKSLLIDTIYGRTETGNDNIKEIFNNEKPFSYPKPLNLIEHFVMIGSNKNDLILDFFSGSATTAHAVMKLNSEDDGNRKYICVQLPEMTDEKSEAYKAGYKNICEIGKERIRRAGEKVKSESGKDELDIGFKVLKLDSSNIKSWDSDFDNLEDNLIDAVKNIKSDRSEEDLVYEILLKYGLDLSLPIEELQINSKKIFSIGFGSLVCCLDNDIDVDTVKKIAGLKKQFESDFGLENMRVVFKDSSFENSVVKTNALQILKQHGIDEVVSV
jgi:adenine-specific DNA-methyltransferase